MEGIKGIVTYAVGIGGIVYEIFFDKLERPWLFMVLAGMIGINPMAYIDRLIKKDEVKITNPASKEEV